MTWGPGKYDDVSEQVMRELRASGLCMIVFGGKKGHGFSVTCAARSRPEFAQMMSAMADAMEGAAEDMRRHAEEALQGPLPAVAVTKTPTDESEDS